MYILSLAVEFTDAKPCDMEGLLYSTIKMLSIERMFSFLRLMVQ